MICASYSHLRGDFADCKGVWCARCYTHSVDKFRIREMLGNDGEELVDHPGDKEMRFLQARPGDHLMVLFQCETCHFRNLTQKNPMASHPGHQDCLLHIRRCNLDSFWSRESSTVRAHLREGPRVKSTGARWGIGPMSPPLGPFPLEDSLGTRAALSLVDRSQDKTGRHETYLQPDTHRKAQTYITNVSWAGIHGLGNQIGAHDTKKVWMSQGATHTLWFSQVLTGLKRRTGETAKRDRPVTISLLLEVLAYLEDKWMHSTDQEDVLRVSGMGSWYFGGFCTALRGEEMTLIELAGTLASLIHLTDPQEETPYFALTIVGRTKMNRDQEAKVRITCAGRTQGSQIEAGKWMRRHVSDLSACGQTLGYLCTKWEGRQSYLADYQEDFFWPLEELQSRGCKGIPSSCNIREEYGIWCTML